jgi:hypothetical protein
MQNTAADNVISITIPMTARAISPLTQYASIVTARDASPWFDIVHRYDVRSMTGPQSVKFAAELTAEGVDISDALGVTWPIAIRNLLDKIGRPEAAPKIDNWHDVQRHLKSQRDVARRSGNLARVGCFDRLVQLAGDLSDSA